MEVTGPTQYYLIPHCIVPVQEDNNASHLFISLVWSRIIRQNLRLRQYR